MKIFWDANVLVDLLDQSRSDHANAVLLLKRAQEIAAANLCEWHSLSIVSYLCTKKFGKDATFEVLHELLKVFSVPATGTKEAQYAFDYFSDDFEDALQISSAVAGQADYIVTRDVKGFAQSPITVMTSRKMLEQILTEKNE